MDDKDFILVSVIVVLIFLLIVAFAKHLYNPDINIHHFTFYTGTPSEINGSTNIETAIKQFSKFHSVILGSGWELDVSGDHQNTKEIIKRSKTKFYGSVDIGTSTMNYSLKEINERIHKWFLIGASGIYLENFDDRDYARNSEIFSYLKMHPSYFRPIIPTTMSTNLANYDTKCCIFLAKNLCISDGTIINAQDALFRVNKLKKFKHYQIWSHNTMDKNNIIYEMHLNYSYHLSAILGCKMFSFEENKLGSNYIDYKILPKHPYQYQMWTTPLLSDEDTIRRKTTGYIVEINVQNSSVKISPLFKYGYIPADYIR